MHNHTQAPLYLSLQTTRHFCPSHWPDLNKWYHLTAREAKQSEWVDGVFGECSFPGGASGKESACQCRRCKRRGSNPWVMKIPWRKAWQPTPYFCPEYSSSVPWTEEPGRLQLMGLQSQTWLNRLSMAQHDISQIKDTYCSIRAKIRRQSITLFQLNWEHASPATQSTHVLGWLWKQDEYWFWSYK